MFTFYFNCSDVRRLQMSQRVATATAWHHAILQGFKVYYNVCVTIKHLIVYLGVLKCLLFLC